MLASLGQVCFAVAQAPPPVMPHLLVPEVSAYPPVYNLSRATVIQTCQQPGASLDYSEPTLPQLNCLRPHGLAGSVCPSGPIPAPLTHAPIEATATAQLAPLCHTTSPRVAFVTFFPTPAPDPCIGPNRNNK